MRPGRWSPSHPYWKPGDKVILNGWGCGETHLGLYAQMARVKGEWLVALPPRFSTRDAMAIGTPGYTAMLAIMALERAGITPGRGPVIRHRCCRRRGLDRGRAPRQARLSGHRLHRSARGRRLPQGDRRAEVIARTELTGPIRPLAKERWAGGIDTVGSTTLANLRLDDLLRRRGRRLRVGRRHRPAATVAPFILRGVSLLGI